MYTEMVVKFVVKLTLLAPNWKNKQLLKTKSTKILLKKPTGSIKN